VRRFVDLRSLPFGAMLVRRSRMLVQGRFAPCSATRPERPAVRRTQQGRVIPRPSVVVDIDGDLQCTQGVRVRVLELVEELGPP